MLKDFFLIDYNTLSFLKEISNPLSEVVVQSFLLIAALFEIFRGMIGKSNVESRITLFLLSAVSIAVFNQYHQKALDISFEVSDSILSKIHITSMDSITNVVKSSPSKEITNSSNQKKNLNEVDSTGTVLGTAKSFMADNLAVAIAWLISVIAIGLSRVLFSVIYYALIVLSPIIVFVSVFPGFESSLKAFWQTFLWCFLAPIVFSVIFVLMHIVSQKEGSGLGIEQLITVLLYGIFLVGSFILTYKITSSQAISGFAEHASMIGAMTMAAPFTASSSFAQSMIHSPVKTLANTKQSLNAINNGAKRISNKMNFPHGGVADISKLDSKQMSAKFGDATAARIYQQAAMNNYHGSKFGLHPQAFSSFHSTDSSTSLNSNQSLTNSENTLQSIKSHNRLGVDNIAPRFSQNTNSTQSSISPDMASPNSAPRTHMRPTKLPQDRIS